MKSLKPGLKLVIDRWLTLSEAKVLYIIIDKPSSVIQVKEKIDRTLSSTYRIFKDLHNKGLIIQKIGKLSTSTIFKINKEELEKYLQS